MFFGLASFEVVALAADHWIQILGEVPRAILHRVCKLWTSLGRADHDLDTEQLLLMEWYTHICRLRARRRPLRP